MQLWCFYEVNVVFLCFFCVLFSIICKSNSHPFCQPFSNAFRINTARKHSRASGLSHTFDFIILPPAYPLRHPRSRPPHNQIRSSRPDTVPDPRPASVQRYRSYRRSPRPPPRHFTSLKLPVFIPMAPFVNNTRWMG